jgi:hypothetical protein
MSHQNPEQVNDEKDKSVARPGDESPELIDNAEDLIENDPLVMLFGDHPRTRILMAMLDAYPQSMNPSSIVDRANISRQSWYRHQESLLETGLIKQVGNAGNSPLYALVGLEDDPRIEWLQKLRDWTAVYTREGRRPD